MLYEVITDCVGELREAVDFLRYYARQAENFNSLLGLNAALTLVASEFFTRIAQKQPSQASVRNGRFRNNFV